MAKARLERLAFDRESVRHDDEVGRRQVAGCWFDLRVLYA
jgi:hypothetical protein